MAEVDLISRDPNNLNDFLKVSFEDVLAEPEGVRSIDCVWRNAYKCFNCCQNLCYLLNTTLCGLCIAMEWGCEFAGIAFCHVWYLTPCLKAMEINCTRLQHVYAMCLRCCLDPCFESCGNVFNAFKK